MSEPNEDNIIDAEIVDDLPAVAPREAWNCGGVELPNRQDTLLEDNPERRCAARKRNGEQCRKFAILGGTVCRTHGGATRHIKEAARIRVENASNRLMGKLIEFAFDDTKPPDVQLKAIQNSLDRAGLKPPAEVTLSQGQHKPYEDIFDEISTVSRADSRAARGVEETPTQTLGYDFDAGKNDHYRVDTSPAMDDGTEWPVAPPQQPRQPASDRERGSQAANGVTREPPVRHITGDDALSVAAQLAQAQRAIESGGHKRYLRPGTDGR